MGLTLGSTGSKLLKKDVFERVVGCDFTIGLCGNPNVGKSTVFNALTGMHQHTGNWTGKTVSNAIGEYKYKNKSFLLVDIPGTYSLMSNSKEEEIARDYICFGKADLMVVVVDATCLERNLNLVYQVMEITNNVIVCVNLLDEAKKKGININLKLLSEYLGVPVVGVSAKYKKTLFDLTEEIYRICVDEIKITPSNIKYDIKIENAIEHIVSALVGYDLKNTYIKRWISLKLIEDNKKILNSIEEYLEIDLKNNAKLKEVIDYEKNRLNECLSYNFTEMIMQTILKNNEFLCSKVIRFNNRNYNERDRKIDKILTSKLFGIPIMLGFLCLIFWITIYGANYPSEILSKFFSFIGIKLYDLFDYMNIPVFFKGMLLDGMYNTLTWVISVMLPPMAIFFPLFTIMEDLGYLPRIAFNLDRCFKCVCASGKQALTMCMGFGCNAAGVVGCRIINSTRERLIAIITNVFVPCNGRFPFLITVATVFIGGVGLNFKKSILCTLTVLLVVLLGVFMTFVVSKFLSVTFLKGAPSTLALELPSFRKPKVTGIIIRSIFDRTLYVLYRAIIFAAPAGIVIWLMANITIGDISILGFVANFLDPFAKLMGLDGYILTAFILGIPANEIVLPIILMCYLGNGSIVDIESTMQIGNILIQNGWTIFTAINVMIFMLLHFPCATTLMTIKAETKSIKYIILSFLIPTFLGVMLCMFTNLIFNLFFI